MAMYIKRMPLQQKDVQDIMENLDKMFVALVRSKVWNYPLLRSYLAIIRSVSRKLDDFELYHLVIQDLIKKWFYKLPNARKWEALSLMREELGSGNVTNQLGKYVSNKIPLSQLQTMIRKCPDPDTKKHLQSFRIYYKNNGSPV